MKKPKIGFLIPRLGITDRGAEVMVYELASRLMKDFEVVVWVRKSNTRSSLIGDLVKRGVIVKKVSCISEQHLIARIPYAFPFLRKTLNTFHFNPSEIEMLTFSLACMLQLFLVRLDILFPVNGIWGSIVCRFVRAARGIPFVYTSVGGIEPVVARQAPNLYITINPGIARYLKQHFPRLRVMFIPTGVDLHKFSSKGDKVHINLPRPIFLTVAAFVPEKRVDLTIKAVGRLKQGSLLIVGDGPLKLELMEIAEQYLGKGRFLFQSVKYDKLPEFYRAADVFAFSAPSEVGWGLVHLEALASGLPVVANREENIEYLLGKDWPLLCDVHDVIDYSEKLAQAPTIKREMRSLVKNYSWEKIAIQYKKVILEVINEKKKN